MQSLGYGSAVEIERKSLFFGQLARFAEFEQSFQDAPRRDFVEPASHHAVASRSSIPSKPIWLASARIMDI
jgi:hypothetical protein